MSQVFTPEAVQYIKDNYANLGAKPCATKLGLTLEQVCKKASKLGIHVSSEARFRNQSIAHKTRLRFYRVDADRFINIDSPIVAYLLGLLWADGYVVKKGLGIGIQIQERDGNIFAPLFAATGDWLTSVRSARQSGWQNMVWIRTSNRLLATFLISCDYRSKSSSPDKILACIPEVLRHYWFRGLLDGDGHIAFDAHLKLYRCMICSCYEQDWTYLIDICKKLGISNYGIRLIRKPKSSGSQFYFSSRDAILRFCDYLYGGRCEDLIGLDRKYNQYLLIKDRETNSKYRRFKHVGITSYYRPTLHKYMWRSVIPKSYKSQPDLAYIGFFCTEEEAFRAQQIRIKELGLLYHETIDPK